MKQTTRVTAKLIAEHLGLSITTVDRALNNRGNVKPATYQRIIETAKELNYTVNKSASFLSRRRQFSIAVVLPEYPQHFWEQVESGISTAYHELRDYGLNVDVIRLLSDSLANQSASIQQIIDAKKFDALCLIATDDDFVDVIDQAIDGGFPVCTFNCDLPTSKRLFYVGCDYSNAGRLAAELLCKFIGMSGKAALITTSDTTFQAKQKITGFREALSEYPDVEMIGPLKMDPHRIDSLRKIEDQLSMVNGIYIANAELGKLANYMEKCGLNRNISLIGHDMNKEIHYYLNQGIISATICQDPFSQGYVTIKKMFSYLAYNEKIERSENITKLEIVTKENAKFYL